MKPSKCQSKPVQPSKTRWKPQRNPVQPGETEWNPNRVARSGNVDDDEIRKRHGKWTRNLSTKKQKKTNDKRDTADGRINRKKLGGNPPRKWNGNRQWNQRKAESTTHSWSIHRFHLRQLFVQRKGQSMRKKSRISEKKRMKRVRETQSSPVKLGKTQ